MDEQDEDKLDQCNKEVITAIKKTLKEEEGAILILAVAISKDGELILHGIKDKTELTNMLALLYNAVAEKMFLPPDVFKQPKDN